MQQPIPSQSPSKEPYDPQQIANGRLQKIEEHLKSIRSMLNFFTVLVVLAIVLQACTVLNALMSH